MKITRWDNSLAVRVPTAAVEALGLKEADEIEIHLAGAPQFGGSRKASREDLSNELRADRGRARRVHV